MLGLPRSPEEIEEIQRSRKIAVVENARRAPFWRARLTAIDTRKLDDPAEWQKIPILDKDMLRGLSDEQFYDAFCLTPQEGIAEYWRSGGVTGAPLFYPRSFRDIRYALLSFARVLQCAGCQRGEKAHLSFPLGIHPVGQMLGRCATDAGIAVNWAGSGVTTPSSLQLDLIQRLKPSIWLGMSSYGLHLANLAEARGIDLAGGSVKTVICSAEPLSDAKREKLGRLWGARVYDSFGMTEAGMMGAEDEPGGGLRVWTDMYAVEVLDPDTWKPVGDDEIGTLVVTPLWMHGVTPFLRWSSGDLVTRVPGLGGYGNFAAFPRFRHAHRTTGFFKLRGININHAEFEDFMFRNPQVNDFKAELLTLSDREVLRLSIEMRRGAEFSAVVANLTRETKDQFEITPEVALLETGTLAKEFETSIKAPRFADRRQ